MTYEHNALKGVPESEWTLVDAWAEIHRLRAATKGPEGFSSWQAAAIHERAKKLGAELALRTLVESSVTDVDLCDHRIIDIRNPVVTSGYMCMDCKTLFRAGDH